MCLCVFCEFFFITASGKKNLVKNRHLVKSLQQKKMILLFLNQNICCGYSKEPSRRDSSFEHQKHMLKMIYYTIIDFNEVDIRIYLP